MLSIAKSFPNHLHSKGISKHTKKNSTENFFSIESYITTYLSKKLALNLLDYIKTLQEMLETLEQIGLNCNYCNVGANTVKLTGVTLNVLPATVTPDTPDTVTV